MQDALELTWATLAARLRNYRFGSFACLGLAALLGSLAFFLPFWRLLAGLPVFLVLGYVFVYLDQLLVFRWEDGVLSKWNRSDFVMGLFAQAIGKPPHPLKRSLQSMLAVLPPDPNLQSPQPGQIRLARLLCWTRKAIQDMRLFRSISFSFTLAIAPFLALAYLHGEAPQRNPFILLLLLLPTVQAGLQWRARQVWRKKVRTLEPVEPDERTAFGVHLEDLDWKKVPVRFKSRFLKDFA